MPTARLLISFFIYLLSPGILAQNIDSLFTRPATWASLTDKEFKILSQSESAIQFESQNDLILYKSYLLSFMKKDSPSINSYQNYFICLDLANIYTQIEVFDSAFYYFDISVNDLNKENFPDAFYFAYRKGVDNALITTNYGQANYFLESLVKSRLFIRDTLKLTYLYNQLAQNYLDDHQYVNSMNYCNLLYPILLEKNNMKLQVELLLLMYNNAHFSVGDSSGEHYLELALQKAAKSQDSALLSDVYFTYGKASYRNSRLSEAIEYYRKSRNYVSDKGSHSDIYVAIYQNLVYTLMDSVDQACELSQYILKNALELKKSKWLSNAYRGRAYCMAKSGEVDSARYYINKSAENRLIYGKPESSPGFYYYLHEICLMIEDYDLALEYLNKSLATIQHINKINNSDNLSEIRAKFDYQLQKSKISELKHEQSVEKERNKIELIVIISGSVIILIALIFIFLLRRNYGSLKISFEALVKKQMELDALNEKKGVYSNENGKQSGMFIKDEEQIFESLSDLIERKNILLKEDLSLMELADLLNTNTTYLSSIINSRYQMSFKNLLNKFRIDKARKLMVSAHYENYSIEGIAQEVGYHSRSAFYKMFKYYTGMTPTQYLKTYSGLPSADFLESVEFPAFLDK